MTALAMDVRELNSSELDHVAGGPIWAIAGAIAGGAMAYGDRSDDGDMTAADWGAVAGGAVLGGMTGGAGGTIVRIAVRVMR